jgi:nucleoid DNA-binding protein
LSELGDFCSKPEEKEARRGRDPQTRKTIQIPAKKIPRFRPGKELRERVK